MLVQIVLQFHAKYQMKARSDNAPHIFSVADRAYQDMLHHEEPQYILLAGETLSGKTTNMAHLLRHLLFLGQVPQPSREVDRGIPQPISNPILGHKVHSDILAV